MMQGQTCSASVRFRLLDNCHADLDQNRDDYRMQIDILKYAILHAYPVSWMSDFPTAFDTHCENMVITSPSVKSLGKPPMKMYAESEQQW